MCKCKNVKMGSYDNQRITLMPNGIIMGIDRCIFEEIEYLWSLGIETTGCCCGHNINNGCIGVIEKDIEMMKKAGYKVLFNKNDLSNEKNFIPKSHFENGKLNYYEYKGSE